MAATKIFPITATEVKALAYIANPEKTDNGRLIITSGCSTDPNQASRDFDEIRARGTGLNTVLSQHFIQSFSPVQLMHEYMEQEGYSLDITENRFHHEIYLSDARRVAPDKLKTVIRHPIK